MLSQVKNLTARRLVTTIGRLNTVINFTTSFVLSYRTYTDQGRLLDFI